MTLILSYCSTYDAVQTTDRLVSLQHRSGRLTKFDEKFNKSLIVRLQDGIFIISHCGLAYLGKYSADEFVVRSLLNAFEFPDDYFYRLNGVDLGAKKKTGPAMYDLASDLKKISGSQKIINHHVEFAIVGFQGRRKIMRPRIFQIRKLPGSPEVTLYCDSNKKVDRLSRNEFRSFSAPEGHVSHEYIVSSLEKEVDSKPEAISDFFSKVICETSTDLNGVGKDSISMEFQFRPKPFINIRFYDLSLSERQRLFLPWLISKNKVFAPVEMSDSWGDSLSVVGNLGNIPVLSTSVSDSAIVRRPEVGKRLFHFGTLKRKPYKG